MESADLLFFMCEKPQLEFRYFLIIIYNIYIGIYLLSIELL